jgi:outer membrane protein insertion porin family
MKNKVTAYQIIFAAMACMALSCSVGKHLPPGTYLYKGATYEVVKEEGNKTKAKSIKKQLKPITSPVPNKTIFGWPYRVAFWYAVGEPKKQRGFKYWLRNKIGEPPVLSTALNVSANAANFQAFLENKGYFKTGVGGDTTIKGYKVTARYKIELGMPYKVNAFQWVLDSTSSIGKDIGTLTPKENYIKKGEQYDFDNIKAERTRTDIHLKSKGYYYFSPDHIKAWVDSSIGNQQVNVYFRLKDEIPVAAVNPQTIRSITLFPNYTLVSPPPDTSKTGLKMYDSIYIRDTVNRIKPSALVRSVTYRPGSLYSMRRQNRTLNRFINMGVFKFVKNRYIGDSDSLNPHFLDVYYYLTPLKRKSIQAEIGTFSKSNSFTGAQASITWKHRNLFKGAEQLYIRTYGSFESSSNDSLKANNNFSLGAEISLMFPKFVTPFRINESHYFPPKTKFTFGYEWFRRQALYTKNFFRLQYDLTWKEKVNKEHTFSPISITYNTTGAFSPQYQALVAQVPILAQSNLPEIIMGSFYNYTFNSVNAKAKNIFYFKGNLDVAGNAVGLFNKASTPYSKTLLNAYFSQYAKLDVDFRYSRRLDENTYWANRVIIGMGFPYGNSSYLPFSRQFIIGGASSIRGFQPRQLGPGRVRANELQQLYLPQVGGDYKLELNTELRFPLISKLRGAVFVDAGNIWTKDTVLYGKAAQFTKSFMKDIAISAGFGFRLDLSILLIRLDIAAPLREPYLPRGEEWSIKNFNLFNRDWRREKLVYNIAIGYPF